MQFSDQVECNWVCKWDEIPQDVYQQWMNPELIDAKEAYALVRPTDDQALEAFPVNNKGRGNELFCAIGR